MLKKIKWKSGSALFLALFFLAGCGENKLSGEKDNLLLETEEVTVGEAEEEEKDIIFIAPSPIIVASLFHRSGVAYKEGATAPYSKVTEFSSKPEKSLALGLYSIDLAYCVLNDKNDAASDYLKVVKTLSDGVGLSQAFDSLSLFDRFEANMNHKDSILNLLYIIQENSNEYLAESDQEDQMVILFLGAWVESMHLALYSSGEGLNKKTERRVLEQLSFLDSVIPAMKPHAKNNFLYEKITKQLEEVQKLVATSMPADADGEADKAVKLSPDMIQSIGEKVEEARNMILKS